MKTNCTVLVVGAGLAGSECAWYLANRGIDVVLLESKKLAPNPAQTMSDSFAELVCSNSLKSLRPETPHGILKHEMRTLGSLVLKAAELHRVPAGDALAVYREGFSQEITSALRSHPRITIFDKVVSNPLHEAREHGCEVVVVASGPLTLDPLSEWMATHLGAEDDLYFYDAIAPIIATDSIDPKEERLFWQGRFKEDSDYLNIPLARDEYYAFVEELKSAKKVPARNFEEYHFFEGCMPIDAMAMRGDDCLRCACLKPSGLSKSFAVVQLRKENLQADALNLVGFQTRLTFPEQERVFRTLPGLVNAKFLRFGQVHRNTYVNAKKVLNIDLSSKKIPTLYLAGQITGVEGYTESAMCGLYVGFQIARRLLEKEQSYPALWPLTSATGALINYLMTSPHKRPMPSNVNQALFPPVPHFKSPRVIKESKHFDKSVLKLRRSFEAALSHLKQSYSEEDIKAIASFVELGENGAYLDQKKINRKLIELRAKHALSEFLS
ncbi:MAG: methylenetetrahydrofolate--tRNA-(uracil(54)-C(5))-methyltransferase (FADH(2)-oxidizing) TrmFO [Oligoflexia bacterium]|nr:methylenetetrahydrofolate--tRNA-(uracil(54)-C(5))-methyltransferase (FADH(2)-oxidizing) TrmFO [Oligoflexia bacterium]